MEIGGGLQERDYSGTSLIRTRGTLYWRLEGGYWAMREQDWRIAIQASRSSDPDPSLPTLLGQHWATGVPHLQENAPP